MKKFTLFLFATALSLSSAFSQTVIPIMQAKAQPVGSVVTIRGIILNDASKMGWTYYIQDADAGIAGYSTLFSTQGAKQGDIVTVTGTLKNYSSLLEISPVTTVTIVSSNNPIPDPAVLTVTDVITGTGGEDYESMLIKINNVHFDVSKQGTLFSAGTSGANYDVTDDAGKVMQIRILPNTDINNTLIPVGKVSITGCLGQYSSTPNTGYQQVPRSLADIVVNSSIKLTTPVTVSDLTTTSITLNWTTDNAGSTFIKYGHTKSLEMGILNGTGSGTDHSVTIPGTASELFYAKAYSVSATVVADTAKSTVGAYITESNSSGDMKVYFNTPVDNSVSTGTNAIYVYQGLDDTLINYINRAKKTLESAHDSLQQLSNMLTDEEYKKHKDVLHGLAGHISALKGTGKEASVAAELVRIAREMISVYPRDKSLKEFIRANKGSAHDMRKLVKQNGGRANGWMTAITEAKIGEKWSTHPLNAAIDKRKGVDMNIAQELIKIAKEVTAARKAWKIGEQAVGGIIQVTISGTTIDIKALDYNTQEEVSGNRYVVTQYGSDNLRREIFMYLNDLTTSYYADKVLEWIEGPGGISFKSAF